MAAVREQVGSGTDVCVEIHRQMNPAESIALGRRLEEFHPYFYEDPMLPDSPALMAEIARQCNLPIATGERFTTIFEYQQLLENRACAYVRPDVCLCGGLTGSKKVAAMAEAHHVKVIPHNPLKPGQHRSLRAARRVHTELRAPGVHRASPSRPRASC